MQKVCPLHILLLYRLVLSDRQVREALCAQARVAFPPGPGLLLCYRQREKRSKPEIIPQCWEALKCALAYLLIMQVLTVHKGHVEPDSVRQLDFLLPSRLLRKARPELLHTAWVSLLQSVTRHLSLAPLRTGESVSRDGSICSCGRLPLVVCNMLVRAMTSALAG